MIRFSFEIPSNISFGGGMLSRLSSLLSPAMRRVLLVVGKHVMEDAAVCAEIDAALTERIVERVPCAGSEPTTASVDAAAAAAVRFGPDIIVAIGGGSVLDTAKALSALTRYPSPVARYLEGVAGSVAVPGPCIPWIAVPTTAGTGAEVTKNAVVRLEDQGVKRSMRSPHLLAHAVIVDPRLTLMLPASVTGTSGLDALTQLVESYVSRGSTQPVMSLVEGAFPYMLEALDGLSIMPRDLLLREKASYGALVSGIALANAGLGAAHGFAAALGGSFNVPHGLACAVLLPHVLRANASVVADRIERLVGPNGVEGLAEKVSGYLSAYGLPASLRSYGIPGARLAEMAERSSGSSMKGNPRELTATERIDILARVI